MAGTLIISDGTVTVNLYDTTTLHLSRDGWRPAVGRENAAGDDYDDVTEVITCEWLQTTDNTRDTTLHNLNYLAAKARINERQRKNTDQVYFALNTPSETNVRYAVIKDINITDLDPRHYGPNRPVKLIITIRREGAWRRDSPLTAPQSYPSLASGTVYNRVAGADKNYIDIPAANVTGDALALPVISKLTTSGTSPEIIIALHSRQNASDVTGFNPHFNANTFSDTGNLVVDANAPGGKTWTMTAPPSAVRSMYSVVDLPTGSFSAYMGSFLVYAVVKASHSSATMAIGHGFSVRPRNPPVPVPITTNYMPLYLGRVTLPATGKLPGMFTAQPYYGFGVLVEFSVSPVANTFAMRNFYLVPVLDGIISVNNMVDWSAGLLVDSILERSWTRYLPDTQNWYTEEVIGVRGRYPRLKPNYNHRLLFYFNNTDAAGGVNPSDAATVNIRATMRYLALRGNT